MSYFYSFDVSDFVVQTKQRYRPPRHCLLTCPNSSNRAFLSTSNIIFSHDLTSHSPPRVLQWRETSYPTYFTSQLTSDSAKHDLLLNARKNVTPLSTSFLYHIWLLDSLPARLKSLLTATSTSLFSTPIPVSCIV